MKPVVWRLAGLLITAAPAVLPRLAASRRRRSDGALREAALGAAERLAYLVAAARRRRDAGASGGEALVQWYVRYSADEVGRLREEFQGRGLQDAVLDSHWRDPGSSDGVMLVALALERMGRSLGGD